MRSVITWGVAAAWFVTNVVVVCLITADVLTSFCLSFMLNVPVGMWIGQRLWG